MFHWLKHYVRIQIAVAILSSLFLLIAPLPSKSDHIVANPVYARTKARQLLLQTAPKSPSIKHNILLHAPILGQLPQLENGCEVTSLAMLLQYEHISVSSTTLAKQIARDPTPLVINQNGHIASWGNPNDGFVGSITGRKPGFGVFHHPIALLLARYEPHQALDLTGTNWDTLLQVVKSGRPVIAWTTIYLAPVTNFVTWNSPSGPIHTTLFEHAVLLVGYNDTQVFINNPLTDSFQSVPMAAFRESWIQMGRQAVTIAPQGEPLTK